MAEPIRICFLADRHMLYDDRIYWKMAVPLTKIGYEVHYFLIGEHQDSGITSEGIHYKIFRLKTFSGNRYLNFLLKRLNPGNNYRIIFREAAHIEADIYHFHDLWLNRVAVKLKRLEHHPVVFYDAREPYAEDYLSYIQTRFSSVLKVFVNWLDRWEKKCAMNYDLVIANEPHVRNKFAAVIGEEKSTVLYNYTDLSDRFERQPLHKKNYDLIYCGAITGLRGALEMIKAVEIIMKTVPSIKLLLLGPVYPVSFKATLKVYINERGLSNHIILKDAVPYKEVARYYNQSKIGLVLLQKVSTYEISMPIKIFEYMAFGLPVVGSNFGHINDYILKEKCGLAVQPDKPEDIAKAVVRLLTEPQLYNIFSQNGIKATRNKYNWDREFEKLVGYYRKSLDERRRNQS